jgi:hypothetical protein
VRARNPLPSTPDPPGRDISRRQALGGLAASVLGISVLSGVVAGCSDGDTAADRSFWNDIATAAAAEYPDLDVEVAMTEIAPDVDAAQLVADAGALRDELRLRIADDFAAGRTVLVTGWLLARTEALLAMLVDSGAGAAT